MSIQQFSTRSGIENRILDSGTDQYKSSQEFNIEKAEDTILGRCRVSVVGYNSNYFLCNDSGWLALQSASEVAAKSLSLPFYLNWTSGIFILKCILNCISSGPSSVFVITGRSIIDFFILYYSCCSSQCCMFGVYSSVYLGEIVVKLILLFHIPFHH